MVDFNDVKKYRVLLDQYGSKPLSAFEKYYRFMADNGVIDYQAKNDVRESSADFDMKVIGPHNYKFYDSLWSQYQQKLGGEKKYKEKMNV